MTALHTLSVIPVVEQPTACNGKMLGLTQIFRSMRKFAFTEVERTESRLSRRLQWSTWGKFIYLPQAAVLPICSGMDVRKALFLTEVFQTVSDAVRTHQVSIIAGKNIAVFCPLDFIQLFVIIRWFGSTIGWTSSCRKISDNCR